MRLFLVRHGRVPLESTYYGQLDVPPSSAGIAQLEAVAQALAPLELAAVHASDLQRAATGARQIAARHALEVRLDPAFREMHLGLLEGLTIAEGTARYPELAEKRYHEMWSFRFPGGGENLQDVAARVLPALERLLAEAQGTQVLVAHNSVNRIILGRALGLPPDRVFDFAQDYGCVNCIDYGQRPRVQRLNWDPAGLAPADRTASPRAPQPVRSEA